MYKRISTIALLSIVITLVSCQKLKDIFDITVTVPYDNSVWITGIPGDPHVLPSGLKTSLGLIHIPTNSAEILADNKTAADLVKSVTISELGVDLLLPTYQDVSMADSIWLYVSANGIGEELAAYSFEIPDSGQRLDLTPTDIDMLDIFVADTMVFRIEGFFVKDVAYNSKLKFDMKLKMQASLVQ